MLNKIRTTWRGAYGALLLAGVTGVAMLAIAGAAQADTWMVEEAEVTAELAPSLQTVEVEEMPGTEESFMSLRTEILNVEMEVHCQNVELVGAHLEVGGEITLNSTATFSNCSTYLEGELSEACEPHTGPEKGVIRTKPLKGILVEGGLVLKPAEGSLLKVYEMSEECAIGEEIPVGGVMELRDGNGEIAAEAVSHLIESGPGTKMFILGSEVELFGSALIALSGEHKGVTWSGTPQHGGSSRAKRGTSHEP